MHTVLFHVDISRAALSIFISSEKENFDLTVNLFCKQTFDSDCCLERCLKTILLDWDQDFLEG